MCGMTHVIPSTSIKDRTVVGPSDKIERMPITAIVRTASVPPWMRSEP